jgi:hypothetical protein
VVLPVAAGLLLYYDTQQREHSWLRARGSPSSCTSPHTSRSTGRTSRE